MSFDPQRSWDVGWAFNPSLIQSDYATPLDDADLDTATAFNGLEFGRVTKQFRTDADKYGKGHSWPSKDSYIEVARDLRMQRSFDCDARLAGWLYSLLLGSVSTVPGPPIVHTVTFADPATDINAPVTSIYEKQSDGVKRKLHSMAVNSVTLTFRNQEPVTISAELIGSGAWTDGAITQPALSQPLILIGGDVSVDLAAQAGSEVISERILEGTITLSQNLGADQGYHPGSGVTRGRIWYGRPTANVSLLVHRDDSADMIDYFLNATLRQLAVNCTGDANNDLLLTFPALRFTEHEEVNEGEFLADRISTGEQGIYFDTTATPAEPVEVQVTNEVSEHLATPV